MDCGILKIFTMELGDSYYQDCISLATTYLVTYHDLFNILIIGDVSPRSDLYYK